MPFNEPSYEEVEKLRTDLECFGFKPYGRWLLANGQRQRKLLADKEENSSQFEIELPAEEGKSSSTDLGLIFEDSYQPSDALISAPKMATGKGVDSVAIQYCVYAFIRCDGRSPLEVLYIGKADIFLARMKSHRRRKAPTSQLLRAALEGNVSIEVYYRDNQKENTKHITHFTEVDIESKRNCGRDREAFRIPSFHLEEIAFIRYFKPKWNFFKFR